MNTTQIKPSFIEQKSAEYRQEMALLGRLADAMFEMPEQRAITIRKHKGNLENMENSLAKWLHDQYEEIAKEQGWNTQENCKVEFEKLPEKNKKTMVELAKRILETGVH